MSIYYYGELVGTYNPGQKQTVIEGQEPTLVGDIIKGRQDYQRYAQPKTKLKIRHYQEA